MDEQKLNNGENPRPSSYLPAPARRARSLALRGLAALEDNARQSWTRVATWRQEAESLAPPLLEYLSNDILLAAFYKWEFALWKGLENTEPLFLRLSKGSDSHGAQLNEGKHNPLNAGFGRVAKVLPALEQSSEWAIIAGEAGHDLHRLMEHCSSSFLLIDLARGEVRHLESLDEIRSAAKRAGSRGALAGSAPPCFCMPTSLTISEDRRLIAASFVRGPSVVWDRQSGKVLHVLSLDGESQSNNPSVSFKRLAFLAGGYALVESAFQRILLWDAARGRCTARKEVDGWFADVLVASPDARHVAGVSKLDFEDQQVTLLNLDTWFMRHFAGHRDLPPYHKPNTPCFSRDGNLLFFGRDSVAVVLDVRVGAIITTLQGAHTSWVSNCAISPDGRRLATASYGDIVRPEEVEVVVWDIPPRHWG